MFFSKVKNKLGLGDNSKSYFKSAAILAAFMVVMFFITDKAVPSSGVGLFIRKTITCGIALFIVQCIIKGELLSKRYVVPLLLIVWWYLYIFFKFFIFGFYDEARIYENPIFIANYSMASLALYQYLCDAYIKNRACYFMGYIVELGLMLIPVVTYVHYAIYGSNIMYEEMAAVQQTNFREASEWFITYMGVVPCILAASFIIAALILMDVLRKYIARCENGKDAICDYSCSRSNAKSWLHIVIILASIAGTAFYPFKILHEEDWVGNYVKAVTYNNQLQAYGYSADKMVKKIEFQNDNMISDKPHTVVMVIGESGCRDWLQAFNSAIQYDDTPWLSSHQEDNEFTLFDNAYGCHCLTLQVLERVLTEESFYNSKSFNDSMNIIDIAKKRGYKTYWVTNMGGGNAASVYALIADRADRVIREPDPYDDHMLEALSQIDSNENNFIVFHGNGSHGAYHARYPEDKALFGNGSVEAEYANAIAYVDDFLGQIYDYSVKNLNLELMVYYSDHGENLQTGHGPAVKTFEKVRIPMFVFTSHDYQLRNPLLFNQIKAHKDVFFTNDMIYNTMCGLINAQSNFYNSNEDLSSAEYNHTANDLKTFGGEVKVADDPTLKVK